MKKLKTSTKNVIIGGVFSIIVGIIGLFTGSNIQNSKIINTVVANGSIAVDPNESSVEIVENLLNKYSVAINEIDVIQQNNENLLNEYTIINTEKESIQQENIELTNQIEQLNQQIAELNQTINSNNNGNSKNTVNQGIGTTIIFSNNGDVVNATEVISSQTSNNNSYTQQGDNNQKRRIVSLISEIEGKCYGTELELKVDESLHIFHDNEIHLPFTFGVYVTPRDDNVGDYSICVEMEINEDYTIQDTKAVVYQRIEEGLLIVEYLPQDFDSYFDKDTGEFIIKGDISNDYYDIKDLRIESYSYSSYD